MSRIIAIDHGYGYIKTAGEKFITGLKEFKDEPPSMRRVVLYKGKYYAMGGERQNVRLQKCVDENYWIMTLAALAEELKEDTQEDIVLAVGLPLTRFGAEKKDFQEYLSRGLVEFEYERRSYRVNIKGVLVFPQGYSAIADKLDRMSGLNVVCDIGSWTTDILPLDDGVPNMSKVKSLNFGMITVMNEINEELGRRFGGGVDETVIQNAICKKAVKLPYTYSECITENLKAYADELIKKLSELGFNAQVTPFIFTGGGASLIKNYGDYEPGMTTFIDDIHANAKGYELLAKATLGGV